MRKQLSALVFALAMAAVPVTAQQPAPPSQPTLRAGDALRVSVWRSPEMSGEFTIGVDGTVSHPLYRELNVAGKTMPQIETAFRTLLGRLNATPQFVIEPLVRVSVGGEVRSPNLYTVTPLTTLAQAVALAGGTTERGKLERVRVFRNGTELLVDLKRPEAGLAQQPVESGDQIFVDRRTSVFRDFIAPAGSIVAALAAVANIVLK